MDYTSTHDNHIPGRYRTEGGIWLAINGPNPDGTWTVHDPAGWEKVRDIREYLNACKATPLVPEASNE